MANTIYRFTKAGRTYSVNGRNRFDAKAHAELIFQVNLNGATFEEIYKLRVVRTGIVR